MLMLFVAEFLVRLGGSPTYSARAEAASTTRDPDTAGPMKAKCGVGGSLGTCRLCPSFEFARLLYHPHPSSFSKASPSTAPPALGLGEAVSVETVAALPSPHGRTVTYCRAVCLAEERRNETTAHRTIVY